MAITRTAITDDDGTRTTGTPLNNAWKQELYNQIDAADATVVAAVPSAPGVTAPTTTGTQTALAIPTGTGDLVINANNATLLTVQGIAAGLDGQLLTIFSKGAGQIDFAHLHASGTALGKLRLCATTGLTSLAAGSGVATFRYDATVTQWRLATHEQGAWITPTFAGTDYTASAGTWTVDSGDVTVCGYRLSGRTLSIALELGTTSVSTTPASLRRSVPGGFTAASRSSQNVSVNDNGAGFVLAEMQIVAAATVLGFFKISGTWAASTNTTSLYWSGQIEVQ